MADMERGASNRWLIAGAGVVMQIALGSVYAWSVFRNPLTSAYGWTISQVTLAFEIAILMLGFASFVGGLWMKRVGPRRVALLAGLCYGLGVMLAGQARGSLGLLYLSYGVLGGVGLGLGYIVPLATLIKWFPDRRGMITGLAVAGFGAGALVTAPVAQRLASSIGIARTFAALGAVYLIAVAGSALFMKNPPDGYRPQGWQPGSSQQAARSAGDYTLGEALRSYGGGFGTMPAFAADLFGPGNVGSIYGLMLTAWGFAGMAGPTLIANIRQTTGDYTRDLELIAGVMLLGALIPFAVRPLKGRAQAPVPAPPPQYAFGGKR